MEEPPLDIVEVFTFLSLLVDYPPVVQISCAVRESKRDPVRGLKAILTFLPLNKTSLLQIVLKLDPAVLTGKVKL